MITRNMLWFSRRTMFQATEHLARPMSSTPPKTDITDWDRTEKYFKDNLIEDDPVLERAMRRSVENGLPDLAVSPTEGKFLNLLARSIGAMRILEVGTLGGYETFFLTLCLNLT